MAMAMYTAARCSKTCGMSERCAEQTRVFNPSKPPAMLFHTSSVGRSGGKWQAALLHSDWFYESLCEVEGGSGG